MGNLSCFLKKNRSNEMKEVFCFKPRHYEYNYEEWLIKKIKKLGYKANWDMGCKLMRIFSNAPRDVVDKLREAR